MNLKLIGAKKWGLLSVLILVLIITYALYFPVVFKKDGVVYYLKKGLSNKAFIEDLKHLGLLPLPSVFRLYTYTQRNAQLKTGEYFFAKGSSPIKIWRQVTRGKGLHYRSFTIVPGWSFQQLRQAISQTLGLYPTSAHLSDKQLMHRLGYPQLNPEGVFFPDTYRYTYGVSDLIILKQAIDLMQSKLNKAWQNRAAKLPYQSPYQALIAASIVEKEAYLDKERPLIASVLINRLRKDMLLQFDPTVIYGLGKQYEGKIYKIDLQADTPYNTYLHKGLPPTPIAMPSLASIEAALHPEKTTFLYFVARGDGGHRFSTSLPEHKVAVASSTYQTDFFNFHLIKKYLNTYFRTH